MSSFQQQDAQEYFSKILDELDKEILKALKDAATSTPRGLSDAQDLLPEAESLAPQVENQDQQIFPINSGFSSPGQAGLQNPLDGLLAQRVGCIRCGYTEGLSMIPFNCLTVPLGREWIYDVRDCLSEYTKLELIEGVNCAKCSLLRTQKTLTILSQTPEERMSELIRQDILSRLAAVNDALEDDDFADNTLIKKCSVPKKSWVSTTKSRQAVVARPPKALVIHVNRSVFDELTGAQTKNHAEVRFPKDLDLGPWCLGSQSEDAEEWSEDPTTSMIADLDEFESSPFTYTLRAVVTHYGRHENGHYICYRKHPAMVNDADESTRMQGNESDHDQTVSQLNQAWWRLSDEDVSRVSEREVLGQGGVFMLFYERCDRSEISSPPAAPDTTIDASLASLVTSSQQVDGAGHLDMPFEDAAGVPLPDDDYDGDLDISLTDPTILPDERILDDFHGSIVKASHTCSVHANNQVSSSTMQSSAHVEAYPTPPPEESINVSTPFVNSPNSDTTLPDTEDSRSTSMTSDDDFESEADYAQVDVPANQPPANHSPTMMRTAGATGSRRNNGSRSSLPMVAAT